MVEFGLGLLCGGLLAVLLLALLLRLIGATQRGRVERQSASEPWGSQPELTVTLSRQLLQRTIAESLRGLSLPLIELRDPLIALEPDAVLRLVVRGDTALLGGQLVTLRTRIVPAAVGVQVVTESAGMQGLGEVAGPLTAKLDQRINAVLAERLALAERFEVLSVDGTDEAITVTARLRT